MGHSRYAALVAWVMAWGCAVAGGDDASSATPNMFAAVFTVRGSVVGSAISQFGPFVRTGDTSWKQLSISNVYTFGLGYFERPSTRRYYVAAGNGLHRSQDMVHWRILTGWQTMEVLDVVPDPVDSALIYIATPWGVFRSTNDGSSWHERNGGFRHWYARLGGMDPRSRSTLYGLAEDDLYRTSDGGGHWKALGVRGSVLSFAQPTSRPDLLLVGLEDGGTKVSSDNGASWTEGKGLEKQSIYTVSFSPDAAVAYAGGWMTGLWSSGDAGRTWSRLWDASMTDALFCILVDPRDPSHLLVGTNGQGVYESFDAGRTWNQAGLYGGQVKQIALYP